VSTEQNKALEKNIFAELNKGSLAVIDEAFAPHWIYHVAGMEPMDREGFKQLLKMMYSDFPDFHMEIADMIADGDKVVTRCRLSGTHKGALMSLPPTGKQVNFESTLVAQFVDGKEVEAWEVMDRFSMYQQLGIIRPMGQAVKG
jgi:predicted ester cyclase